MKTRFRFLTALSLLTLIHCGTVRTATPGGEADLNPDETPQTQDAYFFATDYVSSGQLLHSTTEFESLLNIGVTGLGSSAVIRFYEGLIFVLHDGFSQASYDNLQIIDPDNGFETVKQFSTGVGTNPHDVVVVDDRAFITLYNPEGNPAIVDADGKPIDVLVMDLTDGSAVKGFSFAEYLSDNGDKTARADQMVLVDGKIYVCLQDLNGATFEPDAPGKIGVIDAATLTITQVITLQGRNPFDIAHARSTNSLYVAMQAPYDFALGNYDTGTAFGGLEIVPLDGGASTLLADEILGGYIERVASDNDHVFAVASQFDPATFFFTSKILKMPAIATSASEVSEFVPDSSDVRDMAVDAKGQLWVARRIIQEGTGTSSSPQIDVFSAETGASLTAPMIPPVPVTSIVFSE